MTTSDRPRSIVRSTDEGHRRRFHGGGTHIWKATETETNGAFLLFEDRVGFGKVTPLHIHPDSDETMIVLEGEILMHIDGSEHRVAAGGVAVALRGVPHAFKVIAPTGVRVLCLHTPGCCQAFYWGASEPLADDDASVTGDVDMARVQASARENGGIEIVGPPPFAS
jgi:mannose-6-phosphate isomerase-like protein (cupin superfamily)